PVSTPPTEDSTSGPTPPAPVLPQRLYCPRCHASNDPGSQFCFSCGLPLEGERGYDLHAPLGIPAFRLGAPGGFWLRFAALLIDNIVLLGAFAVLGPAIAGVSLGEYLQALQTGESSGADLFSLVLQVAYMGLAVGIFATTVGKRVFGMHVVSVNGSRVG